MRTRIVLTLLMMALFAPGVFADLPKGYFEIDEERYQLPPDEELLPVPSLAPEEREDLYEYLDVLDDYYGLKIKDNLRKAFELESIADWVLLRRRWRAAGERPESAQEKIDEVRHPLHNKHDPWLFEVASGAFDEDPVDWEIVGRALSILRMVDPHPELDPDPDTERLVRKMLAHPIAEPLPECWLRAFRGALSHVRRYWPEDAVEVWETALTLPQQPRDRDILPLAEGESRPSEAEAEAAHEAMTNVSYFSSISERGAALFNRLEAGVALNEYTLPKDLIERIQRVRKQWRRQEELEDITVMP